MSTFKYEDGYSQQDLFDHLVVELAVVKTLHVPLFEAMIQSIINDVQQREIRRAGSPFLPSFPSTTEVERVKKALYKTCLKMSNALKPSQQQVSNTSTEEERWVESRGKCPDCGDYKINLSNHLQGKHGWSAHAYAEFAAKGRRPPKFSLPTKCCPLDCAWQGLRLDMHLRRSHKMDSTTTEYKELYAKAQKDRKQISRKQKSATTTHHSR